MLNEKKFRLFVSSTFKDFKEERKILHEKVFPEIQNYCSERGFIFQPIDLDWAIPEKAEQNQKTLEICLSEVRACKNYPYPNFLLMLGNRYGWIPLPNIIEQTEFEQIQKPKKCAILDEWYQLDENHIPASYILKARKDNKEKECWETTEAQLLDCLKGSVDDSKLQTKEKNKYFRSITHFEINEGIFSSQDNSTQTTPDNVFVFFRNIDNKSVKKSVFFPSNKSDFIKIKQLKSEIKCILQPDSFIELNTTLKPKDRILLDYLVEFQDSLITFLKKRVNDQIEQESQNLNSVEQNSHESYAFNKSKNFVGHEDILKKLDTYSKSNSQHAFIIHGKSGIGKSSIMAKAFSRFKENSNNVAIRFVGITPNSTNLKKILCSVFDIDACKDRSVNSFNSICNYIKSIPQDKPSIFLFDAIDQLDSIKNFKEALKCLVTNLPPHVKIILSAVNKNESCKDGPYIFDSLNKWIPDTNLCEMTELSCTEADTLIDKLLYDNNRRINYSQKEYLLKQYKKEKTPLYIRIAIEEVKHWKSTYSNYETLKTGVTEIIWQYIKNLTDLHFHDEELVKKVLGFIYASQYGLSEDEIIYLVNQDKELIDRVSQKQHHKTSNNQLTVYWARLFQDLKPFFFLKTTDNFIVMDFFHREFKNTIKNKFDTMQLHHEAIEFAIAAASKNQNYDFIHNRWGSLLAILLASFYSEYHDNEALDKLTSKITVLVQDKKWCKKFIDKLFEHYHEQYENYVSTIYKNSGAGNNIEPPSANATWFVINQVLNKLYKNSKIDWREFYQSILRKKIDVLSFDSKIDQINQLYLEVIELNTPFLTTQKAEIFKQEVIVYGEWFDLFINVYNYPELSVKTKQLNHLEYLISLNPTFIHQYIKAIKTTNRPLRSSRIQNSHNAAEYRDKAQQFDKEMNHQVELILSKNTLSLAEIIDKSDYYIESLLFTGEERKALSLIDKNFNDTVAFDFLINLIEINEQALVRDVALLICKKTLEPIARKTLFKSMDSLEKDLKSLRKLSDYLKKLELSDERFELYKHFMQTFKMVPFDSTLANNNEKKQLFEKILDGAALAAFDVNKKSLALAIAKHKDKYKKSRLLDENSSL